MTRSHLSRCPPKNDDSLIPFDPNTELPPSPHALQPLYLPNDLPPPALTLEPLSFSTTFENDVIDVFTRSSRRSQQSRIFRFRVGPDVVYV